MAARQSDADVPPYVATRRRRQGYPLPGSEFAPRLRERGLELLAAGTIRFQPEGPGLWRTAGPAPYHPLPFRLAPGLAGGGRRPLVQGRIVCAAQQEPGGRISRRSCTGRTARATGGTHQACEREMPHYAGGVSLHAGPALQSKRAVNCVQTAGRRARLPTRFLMFSLRGSRRPCGPDA
jgi:hypothetical protein